MTENNHEQYLEAPEELRSSDAATGEPKAAAEIEADQKAVLLQEKPETELVEPALASPPPPSKPASKKIKRGPWLWLGIGFVLLAVALAVAMGYQRGLAMRLKQQESTVLTRVSNQLELAYNDIATGSYANAKERLNYILSISPGFPGAAELLAEVETHLAAVTPESTDVVAAEPIFTPTPAITATPDLRGAEEIFNHLSAQIQGQAWGDALQSIATLKEQYYDYRTVEVDGFYYLALRNDGVQKINSGRLEEGMYELSVAERLGALDGQADGARYWASVYITGASYWDTNWQQAIEVFEPLSQQMPYLVDASGMTAKDRYRIALYRLGDQFNAQGDPCSAVAFYQRSLDQGEDAQVRQNMGFYQQACDLARQPEPTPETEAPTPEAPPAEQPTEAPPAP